MLVKQIRKINKIPNNSYQEEIFLITIISNFKVIISSIFVKK